MHSVKCALYVILGRRFYCDTCWKYINWTKLSTSETDNNFLNGMWQIISIKAFHDRPWMNTFSALHWVLKLITMSTELILQKPLRQVGNCIFFHSPHVSPALVHWSNNWDFIFLWFYWLFYNTKRQDMKNKYSQN